jgi:hypothetical protein
VRIAGLAVDLKDREGRRLVALEQPYGDLEHSGLFADRQREPTLNVDLADIERRLKSSNAGVDGDTRGNPEYSDLGLVYRRLERLHVELNDLTEWRPDMENRLSAEPTQISPFSIYGPVGTWTLGLRDGLHKKLDNVEITFLLRYFEEPEMTSRVKALLALFKPYYQRMAEEAMKKSG